MNLVCFNGNFVPAIQPVLLASNRGFAYGDGLFETIRVQNGKIPLAEKHFERLFSGMELLRLPKGLLDNANLSSYILELCEENHCLSEGRVRLAAFRSMDGETHFLIQAEMLDPDYLDWPATGWKLDICPKVRKSTDIYSNIKTANFLPYVMAGLYATENDLDDALVLNTYNRISDSSKANVFLIRDGRIITNPLEEGCISGVMRNLLISQDAINGSVTEEPFSIEDIESADEIFLTNSLFGIRPVAFFRNKSYSTATSKGFFDSFVATLFS